MESKVLSIPQKNAIRSIPKYGQVKYTSYNVKKNTMISLIKMNVFESIDDQYVKRIL